MNRVLYLGGFEMPDKNAAAQRVLSIAKALRMSGYDSFFYGITLSGVYDGIVDGFQYEALPYPQSAVDWLKYACGTGIIDHIKKVSPDYVVLYNYPSLAQERVIAYCKLHGIKTVGDITEWYRPTSFPKRVDTWYRMRISNWHLDGIIAISAYLARYYKVKNLLQLPPLVDKQEEKWRIRTNERTDDIIHLVYIGTGSIKDRLDKTIGGVREIGGGIFHLDIIGINEDQYSEIYGHRIESSSFIVFHGRLPHSDALKYLLRADFQIFFRDNERVNNAGFPTKFVESISAGIPVITNRISNIDEYVVNGVNSFMIEAPVEEEIIKVLKTISCLSRAEINTIKGHCQKDEFDYRHYVNRIKDFFSRV